MRMNRQRHAVFNERRIIKDFDFRRDGFHGIMPILYNIHIWSYEVRKLIKHLNNICQAINF
jgi:hypothetical protein